VLSKARRHRFTKRRSGTGRSASAAALAREPQERSRPCETTCLWANAPPKRPPNIQASSARRLAQPLAQLLALAAEVRAGRAAELALKDATQLARRGVEPSCELGTGPAPAALPRRRAPDPRPDAGALQTKTDLRCDRRLSRLRAGVDQNERTFLRRRRVALHLDEAHRSWVAAKRAAHDLGVLERGLGGSQPRRRAAVKTVKRSSTSAASHQVGRGGMICSVRPFRFERDCRVQGAA